MALDLTDVDGELKGLYKIDDAAAKTVLSFKETYIPVIIDLGQSTGIILWLVQVTG